MGDKSDTLMFAPISELDKYGVLYDSRDPCEHHNDKSYFPTRVKGCRGSVHPLRGTCATIKRIDGKIVVELFVEHWRTTLTDYALQNPQDWDEVEVVLIGGLPFDD
jgi:hypothetical protein